MPVVRLSEHFTAAEFASRDGSPLPAHLLGPAARVCEWWLEPLREEFGPVAVHSGFRTASHNLRVGGARNSVHLGRTPLPRRPAVSGALALAADVEPRDGSPTRWGRWAQEHRRRSSHLGPQGRGGIGIYSTQDFVHLDTAVARDWRG